MPGDDAPDIGQPDPGAFELAGAVEPLEHAKKLVHVLHVEAGAVITDKNNGLIRVVVGAADRNLGLIALTGVFDGIADQVDQHLPQHRRIALHRGQRPNRPRDIPAFRILPQVVQYVFGELVKVDGGEVQLRTAHP